MKCILFLPFFLASTLAIDSKSVNFNLQTSFLFDPKTSGKDVTFLSNLRRFLTKLERIIMPKQVLRTNAYGIGTKDIFSTFLRHIADILLNYKNNEFNDFVKALDSEMEEYYYKGTVFHQIVYDSRLKQFIRITLKEWTTADPNKLKDDLKEYLNSTNIFSKFVKFLDRFYPSKDRDELSTIISHLSKAKPLDDLKEVVKEILKLTIFDRYEKLNYTSKAILAKEIGKLTKYVAKNFKSKIVDADKFFTYKRFLKNDTFHDKNDTYFSGSEREDTIESNSIEHVPLKPIKNRRSNNIQEIVLNEDIAIDVRRSGLEPVESGTSDSSEEQTTEGGETKGPATEGAATIIFRSDDNPGVTSIINLADLLWENNSTDKKDAETLNS